MPNFLLYKDKHFTVNLFTAPFARRANSNNRLVILKCFVTIKRKKSKRIIAERGIQVKLTPNEERHIRKVLKDYMQDEKVQEMKKYIQHGSVTTFDHCKSVTRASFWLNKHLHLGANTRTLLLGAFLHDFYLYDWHDSSEKWHRLHGFRHPEFARKNAESHFHIDANVQKVIRSHMWPLTITKVPTSREALIVCLADKYVSSVETIGKRKGRKANVAK